MLDNYYEFPVPEQPDQNELRKVSFQSWSYLLEPETSSAHGVKRLANDVVPKRGEVTTTLELLPSLVLNLKQMILIPVGKNNQYFYGRSYGVIFKLSPFRYHLDTASCSFTVS